MMKTVGIIRKVDSLGRFLLPVEMRRANGITENTPLEIIPGDNGDITLRKYGTSITLEEITRMMSLYISCLDILPETAELINGKLSEIFDELYPGWRE